MLKFKEWKQGKEDPVKKTEGKFKLEGETGDKSATQSLKTRQTRRNHKRQLIMAISDL